MQRSLVALVLVATVLVMYAPIVLGGQTWDDVRYHTEIAPPRIAAADSVLHGELPTWWDGTALGVPLLGEPGHGAAYPLGWIAATPRALELLAIVHVLWCALGALVWARRRGASELGALVAGALIATSGVIASAAIRGALPALAHLPWLVVTASSLWSVQKRACRVRYAVAVAALIGLIGLAGQLVVLAHAIALVVIAGLARGDAKARAANLADGDAKALTANLADGEAKTRTAPRRTAPIALATIAIGAGLAVAAVQWLPALFGLGERAGAATNALSLSRVAELVIPLRGQGWFPTLYLGAPLVALAVLGRPQRAFAALGAVLLGFAFVVGPGELHIATLAIVAAVHAGAGFDRVGSSFARGSAAMPRKLLLVVVALAPTAAALPVLFRMTDRARVDEPPAWASAAITSAEVAVLEGKAAPGGPLRVFRPIMNPSGPHSVDDKQLADALATLAGTSAAKFGIGAARSDDRARPRTHDRVWLAAAATGGALLDRYGVTHAILPASMASEGSTTGFRALATRGHWSLVRFPASPPAALVYEWLFVADADTAIARLFPPGASKGLSSGLLVLLGEGAQNQDEPGPAQPCTIERWSGAAIDLHCAAETAAYAVVSSTALPGWTATVDGRDTPWLYADVMRRAVALAPGEHRIAWRYWPPGMTIGLVLAALGSGGLLALWLVYGRNSDARDPAHDPERADVN